MSNDMSFVQHFYLNSQGLRRFLKEMRGIEKEGERFMPISQLGSYWVWKVFFEEGGRGH